MHCFIFENRDAPVSGRYLALVLILVKIPRDQTACDKCCIQTKCVCVYVCECACECVCVCVRACE